MSLLKEICLLRGATYIVTDGDWMEVLAGTFGVTNSKGSWAKSIIDKQRETIPAPYEGMSFWEELCYGEGITEDIGSWILSYYIASGGSVNGTYWDFGYTDENYMIYS